LVGTAFQSGVRIFFGSGEATRVNLVTASHVTGVTPAGDAGWVAVTVQNPDGLTSTLPAAFNYEAGPPPPPPPTGIETCVTESVSTFAPASGESVTAYGKVLVAPGTDAGVVAQVGIGPQGDDPRTGALWGWKPAAWHGGLDAGFVEYASTFGPAYGGGRSVVFRFSLGVGAPWTYCDAVGETDGGFNPAQAWFINVGASQLDFCNLQYPPTLTRRPDAGGPLVYGQVFVAGATTQHATDPIRAELGYGSMNEDPGVSSTWNWTAATYDTPTVLASNGLANDEFNAPFPLALPGTYSYAFRFTVDGGSYCYGDLDGAGSNMNGQGVVGSFSGGTPASPNIGTATVVP